MRTARVAVLAALAAWSSGRPAGADVTAARRSSRALHVPTAWLPARDTVHASAGVDHRGVAAGRIDVGLAGIAAVDLGVTDELVYCNPCRGERALTPSWAAIAGFQLAAPPGAWFRGQPAVGFGLRRSIAARAPGWSATARDVAELFVVASASAGGVRGHLGVAAWDAAHRGISGQPLRLRTGALPPVRPFAALEWTPSIYPRTSLVSDVSWVPELGPDDAALRWIAGWGIRYQALSWGAIELAVRHRESDSLAASTVFIRVTGIFAP